MSFKQVIPDPYGSTPTTTGQQTGCPTLDPGTYMGTKMLHTIGSSTGEGVDTSRVTNKIPKQGACTSDAYTCVACYPYTISWNVSVHTGTRGESKKPV